MIPFPIATPRRGLPLIQEAEDSPETTHNEALLLVDEMLGSTIPEWQTIQRTHDQFAAASPSQSLTGYSLPAGAVLHGILIRHTESFAGGDLTGYEIAVGVGGDPEKYGTLDVLQAPSGAAFFLSPPLLSVESFTAATPILFTATAAGDNTDAATDGSVTVALLVSRG